MDRDFGSFPADLEPLVRRLIAKDAKLPVAEDPQQARLRGREITFYKNVWFGLIELTDGRRYYFLTRPKGGKGRLVPISNVMGALDRANRQYALDLTKENVADYLNFYFSFTPKEDPMLSRISRGATQLVVPRTVADIEVDDGGERTTPTGQPKCSDECLVRGAVWHFLDEEAHERVVPLRFKRRRTKLFKVSGRIPVQFRDAVFAVDFRVPQDTGVPVLSNEELLFQSDSLRQPTFPGDACLTIPKRVTRYELLERLRKTAKWVAAKLGRGVVLSLWIVFAAVMAYFWAIAGLFGLAEAMGWQFAQDEFERWSTIVGESDWARIAYWWTWAAIVSFLCGVVLTTHRDKIFNWIFRLSPRRIQPWIVGGLDHFVTKWDKVMTAQHTFGKRAAWSLIHLAIWGAYLVATFTSLQILSDLTEAQSPRPPQLIAETLLLQAGLNLPFVTVALIQGFKVADWLNPVAEGILDYWLLWGFQLVIGFVVFKGLYRVWGYTVETSPYTFFRRMRSQAAKKRKK